MSQLFEAQKQLKSRDRESNSFGVLITFLSGPKTQLNGELGKEMVVNFFSDATHNAATC
jgi:hypothetical protein